MGKYSYSDFKTLGQDLASRLKRVNQDIVFEMNDFSMAAWYQNKSHELFTIQWIDTNGARIEYRIPEKNKLGTSSYFLDTLMDSPMGIAWKCDRAIRFYKSHKDKPHNGKEGTGIATNRFGGDKAFVEEWARNMIDVLRYDIQCKMQWKKQNLYVKTSNPEFNVFILQKPSDKILIVYNEPRESHKGGYLQGKSIYLKETRMSDLKNLLKPFVTFYECKRRGIPYKADYVGKDVSKIKYQLPQGSKVFVDDDNIEEKAMLLAVVPFLKQDGAVYYPEHPVNCFYDWKNGSYCLTMEEFEGLIPYGVLEGLCRANIEYEGGADNELAEESILYKHGYTVRKGSLSDYQRQKLLSDLIDSPNIPAVTAKKVANHLRVMIKLNGNNPTREAACRKWVNDLKFVVSKYRLSPNKSPVQRRKKH